MNKIEIAIFSFLFGAAAMNDLHRNYDKWMTWLQKKSDDGNAKKANKNKI